MQFDEVLEYVGDIGQYQIWLFLLLGAMEFITADAIAMNFIGARQQHWCRVGPLVDLNFTHDQQRYIASPDGSDGSCYRFDLNYSSFTLEELVSWNRTERTENLGKEDWVECDDGWVYDQTTYESTISSEWDLVCSKGIMNQMVSTAYMFGRLVGAIAGGALADRIGRRKTVFIFHGIRIAAGFLCLIPHYAGFIIGRCLMAVGATAANLSAYIIIAEATGSKWRGMFGVLWQVCFSIGYMILPWMAYFIRDYYKLQSIATFSAVIHLLYIAFLDESPRWLISQGRDEEAMTILRKMAAINRTELPKDIDFSEERKEKQAEKKGTLGDIFKGKRMGRHLGICWLIWFTDSLMYYGLALNTGALAGDIFLNTFLMGAVEIPANIIAVFILNRVGRRVAVGGGLLFGGVATFISVPFVLRTSEDGMQKAATALSIVGKAGVTMAFSGSYVITPELFPTSVRNVAIGSASMFARISGMAAPFMGRELQDIWPPLPSMIFAVLATISGGLTFLLPEPLNKKLPGTMEEAENFGLRPKSSVAPMNEMKVETVNNESIPEIEEPPAYSKD